MEGSICAPCNVTVFNDLHNIPVACGFCTMGIKDFAQWAHVNFQNGHTGFCTMRIHIVGFEEWVRSGRLMTQTYPLCFVIKALKRGRKGHLRRPLQINNHHAHTIPHGADGHHGC
jgi:hypothetical protein